MLLFVIETVSCSVFQAKSNSRYGITPCFDDIGVLLGVPHEAGNACTPLVFVAYKDQRPVALAFGSKVVYVSRCGQYNINLWVRMKTSERLSSTHNNYSRGQAGILCSIQGDPTT